MRLAQRWAGSSLKLKIAVAGSAASLSTILILTFASISFVQRDIMGNAAKAVDIALEITAANLDEKITQRKDALEIHADLLVKSNHGRAGDYDAFFADKLTFRSFFDALFITDEKGTIIYDFPQVQGRRGKSVADRAYFRRAMGEGKGSVSEPLSGRSMAVPNIVFSYPLRSAKGEITGVIGGILYLNKPNFFTALGEMKLGSNGYFALVSKTAPPTIIMHARPERVLTQVDRKASPMMASALDGFEGTVEGVNSVGISGIHGVRTLKSAPWILAAVYPASEAYALIAQRKMVLIALGALLALGAGYLLWWFAKRLIQPLDELSQVMTADMEKQQVLTIPDVKTREIARTMIAYKSLREYRQSSEAALMASKARLQAILTHAGDAFVSIDQHGLITEWNRQAEETFGWYRSEVIGKVFAELMIPAAKRQAHEEGFRRFAATGQGPVIDRRIEVTALHRNGQEIPIEICVAAVSTLNGYSANAFMRDISSRKQAEEKLALSEQRLRDITNSLPILISYIGQDSRYRFANDTYRNWYGLDPAAIIGQPLPQVIGEMWETCRPRFENALQGRPQKFELEETIRGQVRTIETTFIPHRGHDGAVAGVYAMSSDVSAMKAVEHELAQLARIDALTGLPNRRSFEEKLEQTLARCHRQHKPAALMFADIDYFKAINDTHGHAAGDLVLKEFGARLKNAVRKTDLVARLGGDEFVIVLDDLKNVNEPRLVAEKLIARIRQEFQFGAIRLNVTTSIGIACARDGKLSAQELTARADEALYETKHAGRDGYQMVVA